MANKISPCEFGTGLKPELSHVRIFGSKCYKFQFKEKRVDKLANRSEQCLYVGHSYERANTFLYTHCSKVFELIDRRFAIFRPLQESLVGCRHADEENATKIRDLHRGGAGCRGGGGDTSSVSEASHPSREDAPLADTADSARRRRRHALWFPI